MTTKIVTTQYTLDQVPPPNLPLAPVQYDSRYQESFNNILRLYFNRLNAFLSKLEAGGGASSLVFPYGAFHQDGVTTLSSNITNNSTTPISVASTASFPASGYFLIGSEIIQYTSKTSTTFGGTITRGVLGTTNVAHSAGAAISEVQGTGSPTTIGTVLFNNTDFSNGVYTDSGFDKVYFDYPGIYNIQFSTQLLNFTTSEDNVTMWFAKNGTDIPNSASIEQVNSKHGGNPGATILTVNIFEQIAAGDYISLNWASGTGNSVVATYPAGISPVYPVVPAIILTVSFVSAPA
jgi:hypothetical protein